MKLLFLINFLKGAVIFRLALVTFTLLISSCAAMQAKQLRYICNKKAAHSEGRVAAALQEGKGTSKFDVCDAPQREMLMKAYNDGYNYYMEYETTQVGKVDGVAGFGANIRYVCVGTLFHQNYIGKGSNQSKAMNHLKTQCRNSDNSVHCNSIHSRCRRVNFGNLTEDL